MEWNGIEEDIDAPKHTPQRSRFPVVFEAWFWFRIFCLRKHFFFSVYESWGLVQSSQEELPNFWYLLKSLSSMRLTTADQSWNNCMTLSFLIYKIKIDKLVLQILKARKRIQHEDHPHESNLESTQGSGFDGLLFYYWLNESPAVVLMNIQKWGLQFIVQASPQNKPIDQSQG